MRPFRFGMQLSKASSLTAWRDTARKLEDLGYSTLFIPDHFEDQYGPLVALTVAAEATTTLNVGSLVFDNDYRHPLVLAKECATLDLASEGRLEVGLGAGWMESDYDQSGVEYDSPGVRVGRLEEGIKIVKALWANDTVDFEGEHYHLTGAHGQPRPHSPGGPKLLIGGGSRRVLRIAAENAQIIGINPSLRASCRASSSSPRSGVPRPKCQKRCRSWSGSRPRTLPRLRSAFSARRTRSLRRWSAGGKSRVFPIGCCTRGRSTASLPWSPASPDPERPFS